MINFPQTFLNMLGLCRPRHRARLHALNRALDENSAQTLVLMQKQVRERFWYSHQPAYLSLHSSSNSMFDFGSTGSTLPEFSPGREPGLETPGVWDWDRDRDRALKRARDDAEMKALLASRRELEAIKSEMDALRLQRDRLMEEWSWVLQLVV